MQVYMHTNQLEFWSRAVHIFARTQGSHHSHWQQRVFQTEGKRIYTVLVQYRPSGRAKDQEEGPVGAGGAWPVRPAAPAAAPVKHIVCYIWHIVCYYIAYNVVALYCMF
jgi:hypothetical protein